MPITVNGQTYAEKQKQERDQLSAECKSENYKSCYKLAEIYEKGGATARALGYYKNLCSGKPALYKPACDKLENGTKEVFLLEGLDASERRRALSYGKECRNQGFAGCWNLSQIYLLKEKKDLAMPLIKRSCAGGVESACYYLKGDQSSWIILNGAVALFGICAFIISFSFLSGEQAFKASESLEETSEKKVDYKSYGAILNYSRPAFKRYISPIVSQMKGKRKIREKYKRKLASAGLTEAMTAEDFYAFKLFLIVAFPIVFLAVRAFLEETWPLKLIPLLAAIGFVYPDIWANGRSDRRRKEVLMAMPFSVDMLALSVEAGLDFVAAIAKVVEKAKPSALNDEFEILLKEIKVGASRAEALRNLAWRIDLIQISSFCATLIAADSVGANIGPILKNLSKEIRQKKSAEVEKAGATAATKILFPMLFLIVPAVFIVVAAPIALEMIVGGN